MDTVQTGFRLWSIQKGPSKSSRSLTSAPWVLYSTQLHTLLDQSLRTRNWVTCLVLGPISGSVRERSWPSREYHFATTGKQQERNVLWGKSLTKTAATDPVMTVCPTSACDPASTNENLSTLLMVINKTMSGAAPNSDPLALQDSTSKSERPPSSH